MLTKFFLSERGNLSVMTALILVVLLSAAGSALDMVSLRNKAGGLQNSLDAAALAIATAAGIGWLFWWLWSRRDGAAGPGQRGARRRPGESIRQFLRWLAEAE